MAIQETQLLFGKFPLRSRFLPEESFPQTISLGRYRNGSRRELIVFDEDTISIRETGRLYIKNGVYTRGPERRIQTLFRRNKSLSRYHTEHASLYQDSINTSGTISSSHRLLQRMYSWKTSRFDGPIIFEGNRNLTTK